MLLAVELGLECLTIHKRRLLRLVARSDSLLASSPEGVDGCDLPFAVCGPEGDPEVNGVFDVDIALGVDGWRAPGRYRTQDERGRRRPAGHAGTLRLGWP